MILDRRIGLAPQFTAESRFSTELQCSWEGPWQVIKRINEIRRQYHQYSANSWLAILVAKKHSLKWHWKTTEMCHHKTRLRHTPLYCQINPNQSRNCYRLWKEGSYYVLWLFENQGLIYNEFDGVICRRRINCDINSGVYRLCNWIVGDIKLFYSNRKVWTKKQY